jgi:hypothetical protein
VQREAATFDRLSDLINYQREARFLACIKWAEEHGYEEGAKGYSGEKLDMPSRVSDFLKKLDALVTGSTLGWFFSLFNFGFVQAFPLERHIRKRNRFNWFSCTEELTDLRRTLEDAPIKFQWNQVREGGQLRGLRLLKAREKGGLTAGRS